MTEQMSFEVGVKNGQKLGKSALFKVHFFGPNANVEQNLKQYLNSSLPKVFKTGAQNRST